MKVFVYTFLALALLTTCKKKNKEADDNANTYTVNLTVDKFPASSKDSVYLSYMMQVTDIETKAQYWRKELNGGNGPTHDTVKMKYVGDHYKVTYNLEFVNDVHCLFYVTLSGWVKENGAWHSISSTQTGQNAKLEVLDENGKSLLGMNAPTITSSITLQ